MLQFGFPEDRNLLGGDGMKKKNDFLSSLRLLGYLTQFGLSVILPPLLLVFLGVWLSDRYGIGVWLTIVLLLCGLVSSGCSIYRFFRIFVKETRDEPYGTNRPDGEGSDKTEKGDRGDEI